MGKATIDVLLQDNNLWPMDVYVAELGGRNIAILGMDTMQLYDGCMEFKSGKLSLIPATGCLPAVFKLTHSVGSLTGSLRSEKSYTIGRNEQCRIRIGHPNWKSQSAYGLNYFAETHDWLWEKYGLYVIPVSYTHLTLPTIYSV